MLVMWNDQGIRAEDLLKEADNDRAHVMRSAGRAASQDRPSMRFLPREDLYSAIGRSKGPDQRGTPGRARPPTAPARGSSPADHTPCGLAAAARPGTGRLYHERWVRTRR